MDIKFAQKIIKEQTLPQVMTYLSSIVYDRDITKMGLGELIAYMETVPKLPHQAEYDAARKVLEYNNMQGNLEGYDCDICKNKGNIVVLDDYGNEILRQCDCYQKRRTIRNAKKSGMENLLDKTLDNFSISQDWQRKLKNGAKYYLDHVKTEWFCMLGQSGAGKTHLCSAIANKFLTQGKKVLYMPWTVAVKELKRVATDQMEYEKLFNSYARCEVLYIDDLFKGKITETDVTIAFELINYRYNSVNKITIVSSELMLSDMINLDTALAGRIKERCHRYFIEIDKNPERNYRIREFAEARV